SSSSRAIRLAPNRRPRRCCVISRSSQTSSSGRSWSSPSSIAASSAAGHARSLAGTLMHTRGNATAAAIRPTDHEIAWSPCWRRAAAGLLLACMLLFALTRWHTPDEAEDSVTYIADVTNAWTVLLTPILFSVLNRPGFLLVRALGHPGNAELSIET